MKEFAANRREEKPEFQDVQDLRDFTKVPESAVSNSRPKRRREDAVCWRSASLRASLRHMEGILFCPLPELVPHRAWRAAGPYPAILVTPSLGRFHGNGQSTSSHICGKRCSIPVSTAGCKEFTVRGIEYTGKWLDW